jgi:hypothetical protein
MKKPKPRWPGDAYLGELSDFEVARDGETVRQRMLLMDSAAKPEPPVWRSGFALLSDAEVAARQAARQGMIDRAQNAWRMDARKKPPPDDDDDDGEDTEDARRDRRARVEQNVPVAKPVVHGEVADARAARARYVARLEDAWRKPFRDGVQPSGHTRPGFDPREPSGVTDPGAAAAINRQVAVTRGATAPTPQSVSAGPGSGASIREAEIAVAKSRQATAAAYSAKLSEAWKTAPGVAPIKSRISGIGPRSVVVEGE